MESFKYQKVSIDTMNTQINVRMPDKLLVEAKRFAEDQGFGSVQEFIKETVREKIFEAPKISKKELELVKKLVIASETKGLYGSEKQLFTKLKKR